MADVISTTSMLPSSMLPHEFIPGTARSNEFIKYTGMSAEGNKLWTDGPKASVTFLLPQDVYDDLEIIFSTFAFTSPAVLPKQIAHVSLNGKPIGEWSFEDRNPRSRTVLIKAAMLSESGRLTFDFFLPNCAQPAQFGINNDTRLLGIAITGIAWEKCGDRARSESKQSQFGRKVGTESSKSFDSKVASGFWDRYITGQNVLDIGFRGSHADPGLPIVKGAIGIDIDYPGYDGRTLPFPTESQDAVYSSHCLEHIADYVVAIHEWYRVTKIGGHVITVIPSAQLYERKMRPPSVWNPDHKRFYSPASLLAEFEAALGPNTYRIRHLAENDEGYDYSLSPNTHPSGCYEIELVVQKIRMPSWKLLD